MRVTTFSYYIHSSTPVDKEPFYFKNNKKDPGKRRPFNVYSYVNLSKPIAGIEPAIQPYHGCVIPFNYIGNYMI